MPYPIVLALPECSLLRLSLLTEVRTSLDSFVIARPVLLLESRISGGATSGAFGRAG